jgi:hypothetical protein
MNAATIGAAVATETVGGTLGSGLTTNRPARPAAASEAAIASGFHKPRWGRAGPSSRAITRSPRSRAGSALGTSANKVRPPALHVARERGIGEQPAKRRGALFAFEQPERELGGRNVGFAIFVREG